MPTSPLISLRPHAGLATIAKRLWFLERRDLVQDELTIALLVHGI